MTTELKTCPMCAGEGVVHTGIIEAPTTLCNKCDGTGTEPAGLAESEPSKAVPVAWLWKYIGKDPMRQHIYPVARALHEMDPNNNPYPDSWAPVGPLYAAPPSAQTGAQEREAKEPEGYTDEWIAEQFRRTLALTCPSSATVSEVQMLKALRVFGNRVLMQFGDREGMHRAFSEAYERDKAALAAPAQLSDEQITATAQEWVKEPGWFEFERNDFIRCVRALLSAAQGKES